MGVATDSITRDVGSQSGPGSRRQRRAAPAPRLAAGLSRVLGGEQRPEPADGQQGVATHSITRDVGSQSGPESRRQRRAAPAPRLAAGLSRVLGGEQRPEPADAQQGVRAWGWC